MVEKEGGKREGEKKPAAGEGKKDDGAVAVFKMDLHCEGCAKKVKRAIKYMDGVEDVKTDCAGNKLTVTGKVDPSKIKERLEEKTKKKVEIVSPLPKKEGGGGGDKKSDEKAEKKPAEEKKSEEKKPPKESTAVLKIRTHCEGCITKMKKIIKKIKGVSNIEVDAAKDLVSVKGTMDVNEMVAYLKDKSKRNVEVVPQKKEEEKKEKGPGGGGGGGEKKEKEGGGGGGGDVKKGGDSGDKKAKEGGEKKEKEGGGGGEVKKGGDGGDKKAKEGGEKKEKEGGGGGGEKKEKEGGGGGGKKKEEIGSSGGEDGGAKSAEVSKMEYYGYPQAEPNYWFNGYGQNYVIEPVHYYQYQQPQVQHHQIQGYAMNHGYVNQEYPMNHAYVNQGYMIDHNYNSRPYAPPHQMFSDENPNACSIM